MQQTQSPKAGRQTHESRKAQFINRRIKEILGSAYSWDEELYYRGNPCVGWATPHEEAAVTRAERDWFQAVTA